MRTGVSQEPAAGSEQGESPPPSASLFSSFLPLQEASSPAPQAFEFLNHSVTMLEKESCLQQIKIQQLEGEGETEAKV